MKRYYKLFLSLIMICLFNLDAKAYTNPYSETFEGNVNCTYYAWKMAYEKAGVALPSWGNANEWYNKAKNSGYEVGTTPRANSIAIWTSCDGNCAFYGHVGYVESVSSDGTILYIKDSSYKGMNGCVDLDDPTYKECILNGVSEETDRICYDNAPRITCEFRPQEEGITQYIYLDNAPKTPVNPVSVPAQPVEQPKEEVKKSSNNNLKELIISNIEFEFDKDKLDYHFEVEDSIDVILIKAEVEDSKAIIKGIGEQKLITGENIFKIEVTAEDESKKEYTINIMRKEQPKKEEVEEDDYLIDPDYSQDNWLGKTIIIGISSIIIISCLLVICIKKKKTSNK